MEKSISDIPQKTENNEVNKEIEQDLDSINYSSTHTDNFPKIMKGLNISLAVTSYQAHRLFFIRSEGETLETNFHYFPRPMGIYADSTRLTLGTLTQVMEYKRNDVILQKIKEGELDDTGKMTKKVLEKDPEEMKILQEKRQKELAEIKKADALYMVRAGLTTGMINIHDIAWGNEGLWVVNSTFSCLATMSPSHSFVARWKPSFITELAPEDRCHLNGMALKDGKPKYVTTFNRSNSRDSWTTKDKNNGILMDVDTEEILIDGLVMPHSPRYHNGKVYVCNSGRGTLLELDPVTRKITELFKLQGFPRGINFIGPLMFVGLSKTRKSKTKQSLPINEEFAETYSGIWIYNLESRSEVAYLKFSGDVEQLYDIAVIPDAVRPALLTIGNSMTRHTFDYQEEL